MSLCISYPNGQGIMQLVSDKKKLKHPGYLLFLSIIISVGKQYLYDTLCSLTFSADFKNPGSLSFYCWSIEEIQILPLVKKGKINLD